VSDSDLATSDITTNDVSTTKHGFAPKLPNDATMYLDGTGAYSVPAGGGGGGGGYPGGIISAPNFTSQSNWGANSVAGYGLYLPKDAVVTHLGFLPGNTSHATVNWSGALYGTNKTSSPSLLASTATQTGTTASTVAKAALSSAYTMPDDGFVYAFIFADSNPSFLFEASGPQAFWTSASLPWPSTAPSISANSGGRRTIVWGTPP
jgi:hypothetical protein